MGLNAQKKPEVSLYENRCVILTTKHQKSAALAPSFAQILGAGMLEYVVDTDRLGTFSGEIERQGTMLETVRKKCEWSLKKAKAEYALASEGSFGPHPLMPFVPSNREILYFIDKSRGFHLYVTKVYTDTNYQMGEAASLKELMEFAKQAQFPSHALIVRPLPKDIKEPIFKGIESFEALETAYLEARKFSMENKVWVETDMRAHLNPTRMKVIASLGEILAQRLTCLCPMCQTPGWGKVDIETGLPCDCCGTMTKDIKAEIYGCTKCPYKESLSPEHGKEKADPGQCPYCNP